MKSKRIQALVLVSALAFGYAGAAAYSAWAAPSAPPLAIATDFGPGDGLTRYVVTTAAGSDQAALLADLESVDGVAHAQPLDDARALVAVDGVLAGDLATVPGVSGVELSVSVPVLGEITDPYFPQYGWNLENTGSNSYAQPVPAKVDADVDATAGWDSGTGAGRIVAVVDTGFDSDHPDLVGSLWTNPRQACAAPDQDGNGLAGDCHGWNFYANNADVDNGAQGTHGTSVAGVVGARAGNGVGSAGVAPGVTLMPLVIGGGDSVDVELGAKAIRYAVDNGADVITASWGGSFSGSPLQQLKDAVAYAAAHDVMVVAAAGNDSGNRDQTILYPASLGDANIVTVGNSTAGDTISPSSAYGATNVDLFAPGFLVATTWNDGDYRLVSGTSIAGPQVAAAIALYRAQMPDAGFAAVKEKLLADADRIPAFAGKSVTGGRLTLSHLSDTPAETVRYAFSSMRASAGTVSPYIGISGSAAGGRYSVAVGLGMEHAGDIWALADKPVTLRGATATTDDTGSAVFDLGTLATLDGLGLAPAVPLGDGRYVLTVQLLRDGNPVGSASAAPLLVSSSAPGTGGGTNPGTGPGTPPGTTPGGGSGGGTAPGGTNPGTGTPAPGGSTPPSTPAPGGSTPGGGTTPSTPAPTPSTPAPTTPAPGTPAPGSPTPATPDPTTPGTPAPGTGGTSPGGTDPGGTGPGSSTPAPSTPGTPPGPGSGTTPAPSPGGGTTPYPGTDAFRITSLSPNTVSVSGGTVVTITGTALPAGARVLIGETGSARVIESSATRVRFEAPARVANTYDVTVFAPDNRSTVLEDALTYRTDAPGGGGTGPGTSPGGSTPPGSGTTPPPTGTPGTPPANPGTGTGPATVTGPHGERLVRSATFSALRGIWSMNCSSSCTGVAI